VSDPSIAGKMRPQEAQVRQLEILRGLSGNQRVKIGAELYEVAYQIMRAAIEDETPGLSEEDLKAKIRERVSR
jgi:ribosome-binding protein aMBF1 (putative translation factor)